MNEILRDIFYPIALTACLLSVPLTFSRGFSVGPKALFLSWSICILSMCIGIPGKAAALLILPIFSPPLTLDIQRLFGISILASWGTSYPFYYIVKDRLDRLRSNSFSENLQFSFVYFFGLHVLFATAGFCILLIAG